jgi:hypothetical protein
MILKILIPVCLSGLFVLSANPQTQYAPDSKQVEDVHEAAFRYFFTHELAGSKAEYFCISSARSLPLSFVKRFANNDPPVVWLSECPFSPSKTEPLMKKKEPAVRIGVSNIRWISSVEAEVRGHCRDGELGYTQLLLLLVRKNGCWIVNDVKTEVYS